MSAGALKSAVAPGHTDPGPVTVTVGYSDADVRVVYDEEGLLLMTRSGGAWVDAAATCDPALPYVRDTAGRVLALPICRTGTLALYGPTHQAMLPLVMRRH